MHFNLYVPLQLALLATAVFARPSNYGLMKRHFLCNGVDSETICPEGQSMAPLDSYACSAIASAGRLNQLSSPSACPQQQPKAPAENISPPAPQKQHEQPVVNSPPPPGPNGSLESTPALNSTQTIQLTCTEAGGSTGSSLQLDCTKVA